YEQAYQQRYGTTPVRNAKVNTAVAQIVKRLGAMEAPQVAGWFVACVNEAFVVKRCHAVGDRHRQP
ncbi:helix-turn-helix domain-containing protein, partial [Comamonas aquatica]|nr:helix-turn-helix domain-containing protein [Comamonas aquatica]